MAAADSEPFVVAAEEAGSRLDAFLAARLAVPRHEARRLLAAGDVRLDGRPVGAAAKGWRLAAGAKVAAPGFVPRAAQAPRPEPEAPLVVLAEGPGWVALAKPAGTPVHPLTPGEGGTLLNALVARRPEILGVGEGGLRSGVVHRLDVDTSGAVLFATEEAAWQRLRAAFRTHRVTKRYRAVVAGSPPEEGRAALTLALASHRPARVRVVAPGEVGRAGARATRLSWRRLEQFPGAALLEVGLETGFLHQIRVSLAHLGHPILGDRLYASPEVAARAPRQLLHAARLALQEIAVEAPDPPDLAAALAALRAPPPT